MKVKRIKGQGKYSDINQIVTLSCALEPFTSFHSTVTIPFSSIVGFLYRMIMLL